MKTLRGRVHGNLRPRLQTVTGSAGLGDLGDHNREATALYAWEPYFHNPKLRARLHRITVPTLLLWGAEDRFVDAGYYGSAYRDAIPGARLETVAAAGHFPHLEQPAAVAERIGAFITT